jgi:hypothetical protein
MATEPRRQGWSRRVENWRWSRSSSSQADESQQADISEPCTPARTSHPAVRTEGEPPSGLTPPPTRKIQRPSAGSVGRYLSPGSRLPKTSVEPHKNPTSPRPGPAPQVPHGHDGIPRHTQALVIKLVRICPLNSGNPAQERGFPRWWMVVRDRIELSTFRFSGGRSYRLSYLTWLDTQ